MRIGNHQIDIIYSFFFSSFTNYSQRTHWIPSLQGILGSNNAYGLKRILGFFIYLFCWYSLELLAFPISFFLGENSCPSFEPSTSNFKKHQQAITKKTKEKIWRGMSFLFLLLNCPIQPIPGKKEKSKINKICNSYVRKWQLVIL